MNEDFHVKEIFGFREYWKDLKFCKVTNEKFTAKMKDEVKGFPIIDFVGLKP